MIDFMRWDDGWVQMGLWPLSQLSHAMKFLNHFKAVKIWLNLHLSFMEYASFKMCVQTAESGHYITMIIFVLARLLYFLKWIIFLRGREEKVARFLFPLVEVIVVSPAWTIVKQNFALQIATLNKDVPISSRGGGQIRTFQRCEDILSDEEDIKCGKASLQVGSRLLTYKRVPKWRWFRHTHHCHHHHIIISSSN